MFVPPEQRGPWLPPRPEKGESRSGEGLLLFLIVLFLLAMLLGPIGGSSLVQAFVALLAR